MTIDERNIHIFMTEQELRTLIDGRLTNIRRTIVDVESNLMNTEVNYSDIINMLDRVALNLASIQIIVKDAKHTFRGAQ